MAPTPGERPILVVQANSRGNHRCRCSYCNGSANIGEVTHRCGAAYNGIAFEEGSGVIGRTQVDGLMRLTNLPFVGAGRIVPKEKPEDGYYFLLERQPNDLL
jgi:hypothetical protein